MKIKVVEGVLANDELGVKIPITKTVKDVILHDSGTAICMGITIMTVIGCSIIGYQNGFNDGVKGILKAMNDSSPVD